MSLSPKAGFARKAGTMILGVGLLSSLLLTACSPAAQTNDSAPNPTAVSAAATPSPTVIAYELKSAVFDESKQTSITVKSDPRNLYLGTGVVALETDDKTVTTVTYTPYDEPDKKWTYTSELPLDKGGKANLMRWKDKSYIVFHGLNHTKEAATGLNAEKATETEIVVVLDLETGKVANTIKGETTETTGGIITSGVFDTLYLINDETVPDPDTGDITIPQALTDEAQFMTGLVYGTKNGQTAKLVDPLTGQDIATDTNRFQHYNEAGFFKLSETFNAKNYGYQGTNLKDVVGNYMLVSNDKPQTASNSQVVTEYRLVNTVTKEVFPEIACIAQHPLQPVTYSPNFRYLNFHGTVAFDTKTGASYCMSPAGKPEVRPFRIGLIDNEGNMYGSAGSEYLKVNIADTSKSAKWAEKETVEPIITDKGSLVTTLDIGADGRTLVVIPAK